MTDAMRRREFLKASVAFAGAAGGFSGIEIASAAPIQPPVVGRTSTSMSTRPALM